jgi:polyhydroxyalkanoate synthesis regulator phasin
MLTLEECRKIDPRLNDLPDEEAKRIIDDLYKLAQLALDDLEKKMLRNKTFKKVA